MGLSYLPALHPFCQLCPCRPVEVREVCPEIGRVVDVVDKNQAEDSGIVLLKVGDILCRKIRPVSTQPVLIEQVKAPPEKLGEALRLHEVRVGAEDEKFRAALFKELPDAVICRLVQMQGDGKLQKLCLHPVPVSLGVLLREGGKASLHLTAAGEDLQHRHADPGEELAAQHAGVGDLVPLLPLCHQGVHRKGCHRDRDRQEGKVLKDVELRCSGIPEDHNLQQVQGDRDGDKDEGSDKERPVLFHRESTSILHI